MDIKISTYYNVYNYGAVLQAYSLMNILKKCGHNVEFINLKEKVDKGAIKKDIRFRVNTIFKVLFSKELKKGRERFDEFIHNNLPQTKRYESYEALKAEPPLADLYITGSDQVWNPLNVNPCFFLDFVKNKSKISYAASIGVKHIPEDCKQLYRKYLQDFESISVREEDAADELRACSSLPIAVHCDPVFLTQVEEWRAISRPVASLVGKKYIAAYILYSSPDINVRLRKLKEQTGLPIVLISNLPFRKLYCDICIRSAGPAEFLWLIDHAEYVITSSFHGNAFSVLFNKKFMSIVNPESPSRIHNLLNKFNLKERINISAKQIGTPIHYERTIELLQEQVNSAKRYLNVR